ncbi:hypothetical protein ASZ90_010436 [hydrocarbon metagenome]|uniref:Uncharacterized protein n=1 Tax=hydrocarbon metagenome TaxID=938273 RepID=A0A0W8FGS0_9ZZZZ
MNRLRRGVSESRIEVPPKFNPPPEEFWIYCFGGRGARAVLGVSWSMVLQDMPGEARVSVGIGVILQDEDQIEPGEEGRGHVNLVANREIGVEPPSLRVRRAEEGASGP